MKKTKTPPLFPYLRYATFGDIGKEVPKTLAIWVLLAGLFYVAGLADSYIGPLPAGALTEWKIPEWATRSAIWVAILWYFSGKTIRFPVLTFPRWVGLYVCIAAFLYLLYDAPYWMLVLLVYGYTLFSLLNRLDAKGRVSYEAPKRRAEEQWEQAKRERRERRSAANAEAEEKRAAERSAALDALAKRGGDFDVFRMQDQARPGWVSILTAEQIANFGIADNFEPITNEQYLAGLAELRKDDPPPTPDEEDMSHADFAQIRTHALQRAKAFGLEATITRDPVKRELTYWESSFTVRIQLGPATWGTSMVTSVRFKSPIQAERETDAAIELSRRFVGSLI